MQCLRCGNEEDRYFYNDKGTWYCRKCIGFGRINVGSLPPRPRLTHKKINTHYVLKYPLTPAQQRCIQEIDAHIAHHQDVLIYAACGAGKTELVMDVICKGLRKGWKVGFAISRRQVVLEIQERMQQAFADIKVIAVCEGHTDVIDGDLIICTMHQLYRYHQSFDLLIMDEVDAFPYRGNAILQQIAMHACIHQKIYLTATPDEAMLADVKAGRLQMVELFQRPHGHPLMVPEVKIAPVYVQLLYLYHFLYQEHKQHHSSLVFVPTIALAKQCTLLFRLFFRCTSFTSQTPNKEVILQKFHERHYECLFATTVLERGITIKGIDVVIFQADHGVFNEASLIQMIGRVGRSIEQPTGLGVFLAQKKNREIERCVRALQKMNEEVTG